MKFKPGDRVVHVNPYRKHAPLDHGVVVVVYDGDPYWPYEVKYDGSSDTTRSTGRNLEHEAVYNSPLYKALL